MSDNPLLNADNLPFLKSSRALAPALQNAVPGWRPYQSNYAYHVRHKNGWSTGFGPRPTHCRTCGAELPAPNADSCAAGA